MYLSPLKNVLILKTSALSDILQMENMEILRMKGCTTHGK
nr:MAG TPA: hypothetical protein [Caudoviricetes sp.]